MSQDYLKSITEFVKKCDIEPLELERLNNELASVYARLTKGMYKFRDFSRKNIFDVPERTQEFFDYLESYCLTGRTLAKVFSVIDIDQFEEVLDLCSGWAPKVTLGFYYSDYEGKAILLDKSAKHMEQLEEFMKLFNPKYSSAKVSSDVFEGVGRSYPFVVANHIIDDLIVDDWCKRNKSCPDDLYADENKLVEAWRDILKDKNYVLSEFVPKLAEMLKNLTQKDGVLFLSQYQSMMEDLLDLHDVTDFNKEAMSAVRDLLIEEGFKELSDIPKNALRGFDGAFSAGECFIFKN